MQENKEEMGDMHLFTPGAFKYDESMVFTEQGTVVANVGSRYHADYKLRIAERESNARLFAESKNMLELLEELSEIDGEYAPDCTPKAVHDLQNRADEIIKRIGGAKK